MTRPTSRPRFKASVNVPTMAGDVDQIFRRLKQLHQIDHRCGLEQRQRMVDMAGRDRKAEFIELTQ